MSYKNLNYIIEIAREGSISRAAEKLFISQSALSVHLRNLEIELGVKLFTRQSHGMVPTREGRIYVETANEMLRLESEMYAAITSTSNQFRSIGCCSEIGTEILTQVLFTFKEHYPSYRFSITDGTTDNLMNRFMNGEFNFLIADSMTPITDKKNTVMMLSEEEIVFVLSEESPFAKYASKDYDNPPCIDLELLKDESFIIEGSDQIENTLLQKMFADKGLKPKIFCEMNSIRQSCLMAQRTGMIAVQPDFCVPRDMNLLVMKPNQPYYRYVQLIKRDSGYLKEQDDQFCKAIQEAYQNWYRKD
ncbi:MAG: LysR family transcriptional regulator [Lachnospiraceae bacterium]|nr:LysR family transcriptional regulator [Candidatus Equihabitans merdae]